MTESCIRVMLPDEAWSIVPSKPETTARELCDYLIKKRKMKTTSNTDYGIYVVESNSELGTVERRLEDTSRPLEIQLHYEQVRKAGRIEKIGRAVQQECRDRSRMPSSA
eukprot:TRINITY_DN26764_c0_g1_i1.p1 TRINITY_DN26764_c0_g1~~TRINITY_DN26764_c0_g1_i1.p1  ORF type:complete len:109 (-),score=11.76 TRINITY_DN26764_c0_g1_i1:10-336(-)